MRDACSPRKEKDLKYKRSKQELQKEFTENLPTISGSLPKMYGALVAAVWCFMGMIQFLWLTEDTSLLTFLVTVPLIILISPLFIMALISVWKITKKDHCNRILEMLVDPKTEDPQVLEADLYLYQLIYYDKLRERLYDKVREARASCFEHGRVLEKNIPAYRQVLYDIDREFAVKKGFSAAKPEEKAASLLPSENSGAASGKSTYSVAGMAVTAGMLGNTSVSSCDDLDKDDRIALDMEEAIDDDIMFHGENPFDWDTRSDYLDDPFGFEDEGIGGDGDEW